MTGWGTIASSVLAYARGADVLRIHDAGPLRQAPTVAEAILDPERAGSVADSRAR